jgi:hypothetical protein
MTDANISVIISAAAGISGVILGSLFTLIQEWWIGHKKDVRDSSYLAILVVSHLDRFANGCMRVAFDDGTSEGRPAGKDGVCFETTVKPPHFAPLDINVEWKALPKALMYDILQIPGKQDNIENRLAGALEFDDPPDYSDFFWSRRRDYAELGLHVSAVAKKLRKHAGMPIHQGGPGGWTLDSAMQEVIDKVDAERSAYEKRVAEIHLKNPLFAEVDQPSATSAP